MNLHKNTRLTPQGRLLLVRRIIEQGWRVGAAAGAAGLSERQAYRWLARYRAGGTAALVDRSSAPKCCPHEVPAGRVMAIKQLRHQRLSGPAIARQLTMPVATVGGILRRLGLGKLAALEPRPPVVRYQRERPGELLHIDTKKLGRIEAVGNRITGDRRDSKRGAGWEAVHVCIDDASRLAYSEVLADERKTSAVPFLEHAVAWFARQGVRVERVMTDNGSAYRTTTGARPATASRCATSAPGRTRREPMAKPSASSRPACASGRMRGRLRARTSAPPRSLLGSIIATAAGRTPPWPSGRPPAGLIRRGSLVRPTAPFLRPDLRSPTTGPAGRARSAAGDRRPPARSVLAPPAGPVTLQLEGTPCSLT